VSRRGRAGADGRRWRVPRARPIALMAAGVVAWVGACAFLLAAAPQLASGNWLAPEALAAVHLTALAFVTVTIAGALIHLAPSMSLAQRLGGAWPGALVWVGGWALALGLWRTLAPLEAIGGALLLGGGVWLCGAIGAIWWRRRGSWPEPAAGLVVAAMWLLVVLGLGLAMVADRQHHFIGLPLAQLLAAHAAAGALGWIGGTALAVATRLAPMMLIAPVQRVWAARAALWLWHPGVALLVVGALRGERAWAFAGIGALLAALALFGAYLADAVRRRRRWPGAPAAHLVAGLLSLAAAGGLVLAGPVGQVAPAAVLLALVGFGAGVTAGHVLLMLPTLAWVARFGGLRRGGVPAPPVRHLHPLPLVVAEQALFAAGVSLVCLGMLANAHAPVVVGASLLLASALSALVIVAVALTRPPPHAQHRAPTPGASTSPALT